MVPPELVIEDTGALPPLPRMSIGIIAREDLDTGELGPFIASVEGVITSAP